MIIKLLIDGADMKPGPAIAQQLGPLGVNIGKVISQVNASTKEFKGIKVPVELNINEKTKDFTVNVFSPPTSELIKKELNLEKGSSDHKKMVVGNASIEDIIKITKIKQANMLEKDLKTAVKSVLGTAKSVGILVEGKNPNELIVDVANGKFDKEINAEKTVTDEQKRQELNDYFNNIKKAQEEKIALDKKAQEEASAAKEKETAALPVAPVAAAKGSAPAKAAPAATAKAAPAAKAPAKK